MSEAGFLKDVLPEQLTSHAYIISGESGSLRNQAAAEICRRLVGRAEGHPDIIRVTHEKPASVGIDDIRRQLGDTVRIRPFRDGKKIYIIDEAEKLTVQAQNAVLKTIEEPPEYAVLLLLASHAEALIETVRSRCISLKLKPGSPEETVTALGDRIRVYVDAVKSAGSADPEAVTEAAASVKNEGDPGEFIEFCRLWYRDVLVYKETGRGRLLVLKAEEESIADEAHRRDYPDIQRTLEAADAAADRLKANVTPELVLELLIRSFV